MRMVRAVFGSKSAGAGRGRDLLLQREQFRREDNSSVEDPDAVEKVETFNTDRNGQGLDFLKTGDYAAGLFVGGLAEELESHVPALFRGPADLVSRMWSEATAQPAEHFRSVRGERDSDEEAHAKPEYWHHALAF